MKATARIITVLLAAALLLGLCSCSLTFLGGSGGGKSSGKAPDWLEGAWSYAHYDGEGGAFSDFHRESVRLTVIDDHTLLYEEYYYPDPEHPDFASGVDYSFEREYTYDPDTDCVFISRTDTGVFSGKIYESTHDRGYLQPVKIERLPDKDHLTGHPATRFTLNPKELTGDESGESKGNLRFNRGED